MQVFKGLTRTDGAIMALMFLHAICAIITGATLVGITKDFNLDLTQAGSIETIRTLVVIGVLVITVRLLKLFHAKTLFIVSRLAIAIGYVISAIADDFTFFMAGVVLAGLGVGFVESLIAQTITNLHRHENNVEKYFNLLQSIFSIAVIFVPVIYGAAMESGVSWRTLFLITAILPVLVAIILVFTNLPEVEAEEVGYVEAVKNVFTHREGRLFSIGILVAGGLENMFYVWSATFIATTLNDNQQYATTGMAIFGLAMFAARFANAIIPGKRTVYRMLLGACVAGAISSALLYFFSSLSAFYISLAFAGLAVGPLWPSVTGLISDHVKAPKAGYFIVIAIIGYIGYSFVPFITGWIGDVTGDLKNGFILLPIAIVLLGYAVLSLRSLAKKNGTYFS